MPERGKPFDADAGRSYESLYCPWCAALVAGNPQYRYVCAVKLLPYIVWSRGPGETPRDDAAFPTPFYRYACPSKTCDYVEVHKNRLFVARGA